MIRALEPMFRFLIDDSGQDLIEYGLLIGVITAAAVTTLTAIGAKVNEYYNNLNTNLQSS
jgi:Flp pilus assembly pilin Flp